MHVDLYQRKDSRYWWTSYRNVEGKRIQVSTKQVDRALAELAAKRIISQAIVTDTAPRAQKTLSLERALINLLEWTESHPDRHPKTPQIKTIQSRHVVAHLPKTMDVRTIRPHHMDTYARKRIEEGAHRHTVMREVRLVQQALSHAERTEKVKLEYPTRHLMPELLKGVYTPGSDHLTMEQYHALLAEMRKLTHPRRTWEYLELYVNTGIRKSEIFSLVPACYSATDKTLHILGTKTKGSDRVIPVNKRVQELIEARIEEGLSPLFAPFKGFEYALLKAAAKAGIGKVSHNTLRRTHASFLINMDQPERVIADLLGHTTTALVRSTYAHVSRARMRDAVTALEPATAAVTPT